MRRLGRSCFVALVAACFSFGCGLDGLLFTPRSFDATEAPRSVLVGTAPAGARVQVLTRDGRVAAVTIAPDAGEFRLELPPDEPGVNLRVFASSGGSTTKAVIAAADRGQITDVGAVDARSTARAQLASFEVTSEAGSTFIATPQVALRGLLDDMEARPTPALMALDQVVQRLLDAGRSGGVGPFTADGWALAPGFMADDAAGYRAALSAAAQQYGLQVRCDPSRINAMFAVDMSGRGRDGNGVPQLIRQPSRGEAVYLGFTQDDSSSVASDTIPRRLVPNDPTYAMTDDGKNGDEVAADGIYTVVVPLPRGARIQYKYTNGIANEGFTGTEEWPGNARILQVDDVLTGRPDGEPDCLIVRRDAFGDEASNKNFVNLNTTARKRGGTVSFELDLGGVELAAGRAGVVLGGLLREDHRSQSTLTPLGVPEARENGVCRVCPAPLILDPDDKDPPVLRAAVRTRVDRVVLSFSEPIRSEDARDVTRYLYLDDTGQRVEVLSASPSGSDVILRTAPTHPTRAARIEVRDLRDVAADGNNLAQGSIEVGPDRTPPKVVSVTARSFQDVFETASVEDPTVGEVVEIVFDEAPEPSAAADPARFQIPDLKVLASVLVPTATRPTVRLVTAPQTRGRGYVLSVTGVRDLAGNALDQESTFDAFALYRVRFSVVVGFAFASSDGAVRGLPRGEQLFLTGTPLASARDLAGTPLSVLLRGGARTDVTGWPQFEMKPGRGVYEGQPVYELEVLLPAGSWAYKAAHGVAGEHTSPPVTLEKVYKVLATANDATGVRVDPVTLRAENGLDFSGARLSVTGEDPPRAGVVFKREAPDEVCEVVNQDVECPMIVVGTWRDLELDAGGRTIDYDDGVVALPPHRPTVPDVRPPRLLDARARDSYSILLSYDEAIVDPQSRLQVSIARADDGVGLPIEVLETREVKPHQAVLMIGGGQRLADGVAYTLRHRGATDAGGRTERVRRSVTVVAPDVEVPLRPLTDGAPPAVVGVSATDLDALEVSFDEALDPGTVSAAAFTIEGGASSVTVDAAELTADKRGVQLRTSAQQILQPYRLTIRGVGDVADPSNVITSTTVAFTGFGDRAPPQVERVRAVGPQRVLVRFDERMQASTAGDVTRFEIPGLNVTAAEFSGAPTRRGLAFNPRLAPRQETAVLLTTSPMSAGQTYALRLRGVADLSGNTVTTTVTFAGVDAAPSVDVLLEYTVSDSTRVAGRLPSRAISPIELQESREGLFVLGARSGPDGAVVGGGEGPVNDTLGGFPPEGQPLEGIEPRLVDDGTGGDRVAGDGIYTIRLPAVPLGTTVVWKAFAPFSAQYRDRNPSDAAAAFADPLPGPSVYGDGQEYPGNENGAVILDEGSGAGEVHIQCLFGDEVTYKKSSGGRAFFWVTGGSSGS